MAKLSTVDSLLARAMLGDNQQIRDRLAYSLDRATIRLRNSLETGFTEATFTDYFAIDCTSREFIDGGSILLLGNGFIAEPIDLTWAYELADLKADTGEALTFVLKSDTRGLIYFEKAAHPAERFFVKVDYSAGFTMPSSPGGDPPDDVYENVPDWLVEVAETEALNVLMQMTPCKKGETFYEQDLLRLLGPHHRFYGGSYLPIL